ncbi:MAG: hypothetical protein GY791_03935 [Alphaproteobacteria bacterium]|nr:hypothetical protein [Alphaproteobacteria bacterium]
MAAFLLAVALSAADAKAAPQLFGSHEIATTKISGHAKWTGILERVAPGGGNIGNCLPTRDGKCSDVKWDRFVESLRGLDRADQLAEVNAYFNTAPYVSDRRNYGVGDYWATPRQLLARGGDCEDYAIAKYLALRAAGMSAREMRILVLDDLENHVQHAILVVYDDERAWALDNQIARVTDTRRIHSYRPVYSVNEAGLWLHAN